MTTTTVTTSAETLMNQLYDHLYDHQKKSLQTMECLEHNQQVIIYNNNVVKRVKHTKIAFNTDPTGYGKTASMLALIARNKMMWDMNTKYRKITYTMCDSNSMSITREITLLNRLNNTLIVTSPSIIHQWKREISKFAPFLSTLVITTKTGLRHTAEEGLQNYEVVLVVPSVFNTLVIKYKNFVWKRFIFDEPGHTHVPFMEHIEAGFYWMVTATPELFFEHNYRKKGFFGEMLTGLSNVPDFLTEYKPVFIQNTADTLFRSVRIPSVVYFDYLCFEPIVLMVHGHLPENIETMISAGDIEGAVAILGGKQNDNLFDVIKKKQAEELENAQHKIRMYTNRGERSSDALQIWVQKEEKIKKEMSNFQKKIEDLITSPDSVCNICMSKIKNPVLEPGCYNIFCSDCLLKWLCVKNSCPTCRKPVNIELLIYARNLVSSPAPSLSSSLVPPVRRILKTKIEQVLEIIKRKTSEDNHAKFLIFNEYPNIFTTLSEKLRENDISNKFITGNSNNRDKTITLFKTGNLKALLLNTKHNGSGINLQEATDIILYHEVDISTEQQIIGRGLRCDRTAPITVHQLKSAE